MSPRAAIVTLLQIQADLLGLGLGSVEDVLASDLPITDEDRKRITAAVQSLEDAGVEFCMACKPITGSIAQAYLHRKAEGES